MKHAKISLIAGLSIISMVGPANCATPAHAANRSEPVHKQLTIALGEIDPGSQDGAAQITNLVRREARRACIQMSSRFSEVRRRQSKCVKSVMQDAMPQIERLHRRALLQTGQVLAENTGRRSQPRGQRSCNN